MAENSPADESDTEKRKDMSASMNPLKSHFGIDLGLPKPLLYIINAILILFFTTTRILLYTVIGIVGFAIGYIVSYIAYCPLFASDIIGCYTTQYTNPYVVGVGVIGSLGLIVIAAFIDLHTNWKKQF